MRVGGRKILMNLFKCYCKVCLKVVWEMMKRLFRIMRRNHLFLDFLEVNSDLK